MKVSKGKIDKRILANLLRQGRSRTYCARRFGVSESTVGRAERELKAAAMKSALLENVAASADGHLDTIGQLRKINDYANELLDPAMSCARGGSAALRTKDPRALALDIMAEIRAQLKLQLELFRGLYDMQAVAEFQREVLDVVGEADKEIRDEIIRRLSEKSALRRAVGIL